MNATRALPRPAPVRPVGEPAVGAWHGGTHVAATEPAGSGWQPRSGCTPGCLPAPGALARVGTPTVLARAVGLVAGLAALGLAALVGAPLCGGGSVRVLPSWLPRRLLRLIGVRVVVRGGTHYPADEPAGGVLVVANHLSWLDVLALGTVQPMRLVAKREVGTWPVIGPVARRCGTLFIDRSGLRTLPAAIDQLREALRAGAVVGLFPEGTTWCGAAAGRFRRAGFQAALDAGVPVRPVALRLLLPDGTPTSAGAYIADDTLLASVRRVLRLPGLVVEVRLLPPLPPAPGVDRAGLARAAERAIASATGVPEPTRAPAAAPSVGPLAA